MNELWSIPMASFLKSMLFDFGAFTWPLLALLLLKKLKHIQKLTSLLIMTIFLVGSSFLSTGIFAILHFLAPDDPLESCSASSIVVLSGGAVNEITPSISTQLRLQKALEIEKMQSLPLVFSGGITEIAVPESETMASYFHLLDSTNNKRIYTERDSLNTHQNALYTKELLEKLQIEKDVILITSSYHMLRSSLVFNHLGFKVCKASAEIEPGSKWRISYKNADRTVIAFNELAGLAGYYLKGWL